MDTLLLESENQFGDGRLREIEPLSLAICFRENCGVEKHGGFSTLDAIMPWTTMTRGQVSDTSRLCVADRTLR